MPPIFSDASALTVPLLQAFSMVKLLPHPTMPPIESAPAKHTLPLKETFRMMLPASAFPTKPPNPTVPSTYPSERETFSMTAPHARLNSPAATILRSM